MDMIKYAFAFSDIEVLKAYVDCYDPVCGCLGLQEQQILIEGKYERVANLLEKFDVHGDLTRCTELYIKNTWRLGIGY